MSVRIVAPTAVVTAGSRESPSRGGGGVGQERVAGEHAAQEDGRRPPEPQRQPPDGRPDDLGQREREQAERQALPAVAGELVEVDLEAGQEHDVEQADGPQEHHRRVAVEHAERVGPERDAGHEQQHRRRHAAPRDQRRRQQHEQDRREHGDRVAEGERSVHPRGGGREAPMIRRAPGRPVAGGRRDPRGGAGRGAGRRGASLGHAHRAHAHAHRPPRPLFRRPGGVPRRPLRALRRRAALRPAAPDGPEERARPEEEPLFRAQAPSRCSWPSATAGS